MKRVDTEKVLYMLDYLIKHKAQRTEEEEQEYRQKILDIYNKNNESVQSTNKTN